MKYINGIILKTGVNKMILLSELESKRKIEKFEKWLISRKKYGGKRK